MSVENFRKDFLSLSLDRECRKYRELFMQFIKHVNADFLLEVVSRFSDVLQICCRFLIFPAVL